MTTFVELCAGTAEVSLRILDPLATGWLGLTGFMGSKKRWGGDIAALLGGRPDRILLVDAGPWGDVWTVLRRRGGACRG